MRLYPSALEPTLTQGFAVSSSTPSASRPVFNDDIIQHNTAENGGETDNNELYGSENGNDG